MLTKVYIAQNAFEQAVVILNLFYLQVRLEKHMFEWSEFMFFSTCR